MMLFILFGVIVIPVGIGRCFGRVVAKVSLI